MMTSVVPFLEEGERSLYAPRVNVYEDWPSSASIQDVFLISPVSGTTAKLPLSPVKETNSLKEW